MISSSLLPHLYSLCHSLDLREAALRTRVPEGFTLKGTSLKIKIKGNSAINMGKEGIPQYRAFLIS